MYDVCIYDICTKYSINVLFIIKIYLEFQSRFGGRMDKQRIAIAITNVSFDFLMVIECEIL